MNVKLHKKINVFKSVCSRSAHIGQIREKKIYIYIYESLIQILGWCNTVQWGSDIPIIKTLDWGENHC